MYQLLHHVELLCILVRRGIADSYISGCRLSCYLLASQRQTLDLEDHLSHAAPRALMVILSWKIAAETQ
jgi:hypothetical protein